jgi:REP element-mobilizing transposase RayT
MHPPRLTRLEQIFPGYGIFFITCCTHLRAKLLANPEVHQSFRTFCVAAQERHVWVGRYVIMPDHLHFFVDYGEEITLGVWMKALKNSLSKILREKGYGAPHWQKGYFDHLVRSEASYEEKWQYTYHNPVRAGLAATPEEWRYQGEIAPLPFE